METEAAPPRAKKAKPERPKFDVKCIECGTAAQVPFKPIEGRDVFCQPCYRARRGIVEPATAGAPLAPETSPDASATAPIHEAIEASGHEPAHEPSHDPAHELSDSGANAASSGSAE